MRSGFEKVTEGLKKVHKGHNSYSKSLDKVGIFSKSLVKLC